MLASFPLYYRIHSREHSRFKIRPRNNTDNKFDAISIQNTLDQFELRKPVKNGPRVAPTEPVPSIMAQTVAMHFSDRLSRRDTLLPLAKSVEIVVVINAYGPFMKNPTRNNMDKLTAKLYDPKIS